MGEIFGDDMLPLMSPPAAAEVSGDRAKRKICIVMCPNAWQRLQSQKPLTLHKTSFIQAEKAG